MAYLQHSNWRDRPGAIVAVIAIHGLVGYALVTGLSFTKIMDAVPGLEGYEVKVPLDPLPPPPPPPPKPTIEPKIDAVRDRPLVAPLPPIDLGPVRPVIDTTPIVVALPDFTPRLTPSAGTGSGATRPAFDPVGARPRNDPGNWVTVNDYRPNWISREMTGVARFRLEIAANGRVSGCAITGSSGYPELDRATCDLITRRARFEPAKDTAGAKVSGSYVNSVRWELPD